MNKYAFSKKLMAYLLSIALILNVVTPMTAFADENASEPSNIQDWAVAKQQKMTEQFSTKYASGSDQAVEDFLTLVALAKSGVDFNQATLAAIKEKTVNDEFNFKETYNIKKQAEGALAIRAAGYDPKSYYLLDFPKKIDDRKYLQYQDTINIATAILAMNSDQYHYENYLTWSSYLTNRQKSEYNGGFTTSNSSTVICKDRDMALVIISLLSFEDDNTTEAVNKAIDYIGTRLEADDVTFTEIAYYSLAIFEAAKKNNEKAISLKNKALEMIRAYNIENSADFSAEKNGSTSDSTATLSAYYALSSYVQSSALFDLSGIEKNKETEVPEFAFDKTKGEITSYRGKGGEIETPDQIDGENVRSIGSYVFALKKSSYGNGIEYEITKVKLPNNLEKIGLKAFANQSLTDITIPATVNTISSEAFAGSKLNSIQFTDNSLLTEIGDSAFSDCQLSKIDLPNGLQSIGKKTFEKNFLAAVDIPDSVNSIGNSAFSKNYIKPDKEKSDYLLTRVNCKNT